MRFPALSRSVVAIAGLVAIWVVGVTAVMAEGKPAGEAAGEGRFAGFSEKHQPVLMELASIHRDVFEQWEELSALLRGLREAESVFGVKKRADAKRRLPRLQKAAERASERFDKTFYKAREAYSKPLAVLKEREMRLGAQLDFDDDSPKNRAIQEKIDALTEEMIVVDLKIDALDKVFSSTKGLKEISPEYRLYGMDERAWSSILKQFPEAVEARRLVQDHLGDIQEGEKYRGTDKWSANAERRMENLQKGLGRSRRLLASRLAKAREPYEKEAAKIEKGLGKLTTKIERSKKPEKYRGEAKELEERMEDIKETLDLLDKLAGKPEAEGGKKR